MHRNVLDTAADTATGFLLLPPNTNAGVEEGNVVFADTTCLCIFTRERGIGKPNPGFRVIGGHSAV
jgi:hypothetical protein